MIKTRYPELDYQELAPYLWRIVDASTGNVIGPCYRTRVELLADLDRFYQERFGSVEQPVVRMCPGRDGYVLYFAFDGDDYVRINPKAAYRLMQQGAVIEVALECADDRSSHLQGRCKLEKI